VHAWYELLVFLLFAVPIALIDIREYRIPDVLSLGGIAVFVVLRLLWKEQSFQLLAIECAAGFAAFWLVCKVTRGQMGLGDAKFSAFIAVAAGLQWWFAALFVASLLGLLFAAVCVGIFKVDRKALIPFAPFLTAGATIALLFRNLHGAVQLFQT
jgi:Flp pilus assembly protein protease CpaA